MNNARDVRGVKAWRPLLLVSLALYVLALLSPGIVPDVGIPWSGGVETAGYECLILGPLSWMVNPIMIVAWSANLLYFGLIAFALMPRARADVPPAVGIIPFLVGLSGLLVKKSSNIETGPMIPVHLGSGGWLWLASLFVFAPIFLLKKTPAAIAEAGSKL